MKKVDLVAHFTIYLNDDAQNIKAADCNASIDVEWEDETDECSLPIASHLVQVTSITDADSDDQ